MCTSTKKLAPLPCATRTMAPPRKTLPLTLFTAKSKPSHHPPFHSRLSAFRLLLFCSKKVPPVLLQSAAHSKQMSTSKAPNPSLMQCLRDSTVCLGLFCSLPPRKGLRPSPAIRFFTVALSTNTPGTIFAYGQTGTGKTWTMNGKLSFSSRWFRTSGGQSQAATTWPFFPVFPCF